MTLSQRKTPPVLPSFRQRLLSTNPHLAKGAARFQHVSPFVWSLALVIYTYAIAVSVRRSVPPCQCALTPTARKAPAPRLEYREENSCDPLRWAMWGQAKPVLSEPQQNAESEKTDTAKDEKDSLKKAGDGVSNESPDASSTKENRQAHENPHASKVASRFQFYGGKRGDSPYDADRVAYTKFFAGTGDSVRKESNVTFERREDMRNGFFVEVGAGDGEKNSLSLFFEKELNWTGLLIEGATPNYRKLNGTKKRKASTVKLASAVCEKTNSAYMIGSGESAGLVERFASREKEEGLKVWDTEWKTPYKVSCVRMADLLKSNNVTAVDLMTIDLRAAEVANTLRGMNFEAVPVKVLMVNMPEAKVSEKKNGMRESEVRHMLLSNDFCLAARVGPIEYWVHDAELRRQHCGWTSFYATP